MAQLDPETVAGFHFIECAASRVETDLIPDFFLAGPNRTGSTWLHEQLCRHPEVHFATPKEIYFFDTLGRPKHFNYQSHDLAWYLDLFRRTPEVTAARQQQCQADFGRDFAPKVQGEASASYAAGLDDTRAAEVVRLNPDIKVLITVRHPIERAWSHVKFDAREFHQSTVEELSEAQLHELCFNPYVINCGMYSAMGRLWSGHLKPGNLHFVLFDRIASEPVALLREVAGFLGVDDSPELFGKFTDLGKNETESAPIPAAIRAEWERIYARELEILSEFFGIDWRVRNDSLSGHNGHNGH